MQVTQNRINNAIHAAEFHSTAHRDFDLRTKLHTQLHNNRDSDQREFQEETLTAGAQGQTLSVRPSLRVVFFFSLSLSLSHTHTHTHTHTHAQT